ncbi:MAG: methyltransferase domain-containing protein [Bacteroidetes bacterium]|nr:methyltransferase domain-containing protein [Bacteroidota bacterium]MBS1739345.1 methyltransferase domain-containing protein [Bacteroidota bacterium]MBS1776272.1 methyltransferase domain-containing protein [Bacteroidota bacterium]
MTSLSKLDATFWNERWVNQATGWDIGYASPAITEYFNQYRDRNASILIPGCGNAYEAEYLSVKGYSNITLVDFAPDAVIRLKEKFKKNPEVHVIQTDFFEHVGNYDLIVEQTFFCALVPAQRQSYVQKMHSLLQPNGKIIGLLFNISFEKDGPPFGGTIEEYITLFSPYFDIQIMAPAFNSIAPRAGSELFVILKRKP